MSTKVRGALFNILGDIEGLDMLDAFAGSGAIGFEAISRGISRVTALDSDNNAQKIVIKNVKALSLSKKFHIVRSSANAWLQTTDSIFNIVVCDPPYDNPQLPLLKQLSNRVRAEGIFVVSLPPKLPFKLEKDFILLIEKIYGDASLRIFRRNTEIIGN